MVRTAAQYARIAAIYEGAVKDPALPVQSRAAFGKKASWFRMLAQLEAIKAGAALAASSKQLEKNRNFSMLAWFTCREIELCECSHKSSWVSNQVKQNTAMNISDIRTKADALNGRSDLVTRSPKPDDTLVSDPCRYPRTE